jgi:hypothetical protein
VCGKCYERMYAVTSSYRRKDGPRRRTYACHNYHFGTGECDARPIDAELVDREVVAGLDKLLVDFEGWRAQIEDRHTSERNRLADEVAKAPRPVATQSQNAYKERTNLTEHTPFIDFENLPARSEGSSSPSSSRHEALRGPVRSTPRFSAAKWCWKRTRA